MREDNKLIHLGSSLKPHGIAGGFGARLFNTEESVVKKGVKLILKPKSSASSLAPEGAEFTIKKVSLGNKAILFFEEVEDRNQAEEILPFDLYIHREWLPETSEDEYYIDDLLGMLVVNESGEKIGEVINYFDNGAQLVLTIKKTNEQKGKGNSSMVELPFVESFFPKVDFEGRVLTMIEPEII